MDCVGLICGGAGDFGLSFGIVVLLVRETASDVGAGWARGQFGFSTTRKRLWCGACVGEVVATGGGGGRNWGGNSFLLRQCLWEE